MHVEWMTVIALAVFTGGIILVETKTEDQDYDHEGDEIVINAHINKIHDPVSKGVQFVEDFCDAIEALIY